MGLEEGRWSLLWTSYMQSWQATSASADHVTSFERTFGKLPLYNDYIVMGFTTMLTHLDGCQYCSCSSLNVDSRTGTNESRAGSKERQLNRNRGRTNKLPQRQPFPDVPGSSPRSSLLSQKGEKCVVMYAYQSGWL